jgi:hypothetical protein
MDFFICGLSQKGLPGHRELCSRALASSGHRDRKTVVSRANNKGRIGLGWPTESGVWGTQVPHLAGCHYL